MHWQKKNELKEAQGIIHPHSLTLNMVSQCKKRDMLINVTIVIVPYSMKRVIEELRQNISHVCSLLHVHVCIYVKAHMWMSKSILSFKNTTLAD